MAEVEGVRRTRRQVLVAGAAGVFSLALPRNTVVPSPPDGAVRLAPLAAGSLTGRTVALDPGHNGRNWANPSYINRPVWNGRHDEACDTCGTATNDGYTEAEFNFTMANLVAAGLRRQGASVVLTRPSNAGVGPCVPTRAAIGNLTHSDVALSIHADGGPPCGYGFTLLVPVDDGINHSIIVPSSRLSVDLRTALLATGVNPVSSYDGVHGIQPRDDLGGLNLSIVPKVLIECANMRNARDAAKLIDPAWQRRTAAGLVAGLSKFLLT